MHTDVETKCAAKAARVRHMSREDETSLLDLHVNAEEICKNRQIGVNMKEIMELVRYTKISYLRKQIKCFIWVLLNTLLTLIYPSCISFVIDHGVEKRDMSTVVNSVVILLLLGLLIILTNYIQQLKYTKLGREICEKLKNRIFQKLCNTNYKFWSKNRVGDILTVINTDISSVEKLFTTTINNAILNSLYFLGIIIILFLLNYVIGIWISILLIGFMILQRKNGKKIKNGMTELRTKMGIFNSNTQEMISNMPDIQLVYPNNNSLFRLDKKSKNMLKLEGLENEQAYKYLSSVMIVDETDELFNNMKQSGLLVDEKKSISNKIEETAVSPMGVTLMIIQECNLQCTYYYGEGGEYQDRGKMSLDIAKKSIDFLIANTKNKNLLVCFLGGEPMMNFQLIQDVVAYCEEYEKKQELHFRYTITTNGTIWNEEVEEFFRKNQFTVQISIYGKKEVHNCNRCYASGKGSFDVMETNTRSMRNDGLVSGRATLTATNLNLIDNFRSLNEMNLNSIPMAPAQNLLSDEDYEKLIKENTKLAEYFLKLVKDGDFKTAKKLRILMSGLYKIHKSGIERNIPCGVGSSNIAVDINGDIFPCHRFAANKEYVMANVLRDTEMNNKSFLEEIDIDKHEECKKCWVKNLCAGGCPNENLVNAGSTQKSAEKSCKFIRSMYNDLIHVYLELTSNDKKQLWG